MSLSTKAKAVLNGCFPLSRDVAKRQVPTRPVVRPENSRPIVLRFRVTNCVYLSCWENKRKPDPQGARAGPTFAEQGLDIADLASYGVSHLLGKGHQVIQFMRQNVFDNLDVQVAILMYRQIAKAYHRFQMLCQFCVNQAFAL